MSALVTDVASDLGTFDLPACDVIRVERRLYEKIEHRACEDRTRPNLDRLLRLAAGRSAPRVAGYARARASSPLRAARQCA